MTGKIHNFFNFKGSLWVQIALLIGSFGFLYAHSVTKLIHDWNTDDNFSHGFLIPVISAFMIWQQREALAKKVIKPSMWGIVIIVGAMVMHIVGNIGAELFIMRSSIIFCLLGVCIYIFGFSIATMALVPILYLFFMIPIPAIIWNQIAFPLKLFAAKLSASMIRLSGIPVLREGNVLYLSNITLEVVDACSGLRSLTSLLALSAAFAYISNLKIFNKWALFLFAIPIAIVVNIIRLTVTAILARYVGPETAHGFLHDLSGVVVFIVAFVSLYAVQVLLYRIEIKLR